MSSGPPLHPPTESGVLDGLNKNVISLFSLLSAICIVMLPALLQWTHRGAGDIIENILLTILIITGTILVFLLFKSAVNRYRQLASRRLCRKAHRMLFVHLAANSLKGYADPLCRNLQRQLEVELERHCCIYPNEYTHKDIMRMRFYSNRVKELHAVRD